MKVVETKCPHCGAEETVNSSHFEALCYKCKDYFNIQDNIKEYAPLSEKISEKENEVLETLTSFIEQVQVRMITDVEYYNKVVEALDKKGLLPKYDKLQQAKKEALKIINIK